MRDSMIFYRSFFEAIQNLNADDQCSIYNAIFTYGLDFKEPQLTGVALSFWTLIKPQIDANIKRYENGKKPKIKQNESKSKAKNKQKISKVEANVNVNDNVNDLSNDKNSFDVFWNIYDKKSDRAKCLKAWLNIHPHKHGLIYEQARKYVQSTPDSKYRKNPLTWLNGQCWEDEIKTETKTEIFDPLVEYCKKLGIQ